MNLISNETRTDPFKITNSKMNKLQSTILLSALMLIISLRENYAQETNGLQPIIWEEQQEKAFESLVSTNRDVRFLATWNLGNQRNEVVGKLMAILDGSYSDNIKMDAVAVLGEYKAPEAVPFLVQHLEWDDVPHEFVSKSIYLYSRISDEYLDALDIPMSAALVKIGMSAIPALLDKITQTDDANITKKCVSICQSIEGQDVTQFRLQGLLDKETDQTKKVRIQSALNALKNLDAGK